ncbi:MAG: sulfide/dihydroorotate dehydrogenase-like FAD/NAD-binding protein [Deltaproteobacteria bacterium]|nr:sulfide/dihydroorotate dehydrogenase-like FAD/NAD-binding protein [Deltaproteobacteria bacterium]
MFKILSKKTLVQGKVILIRVDAPYIAKKAKPGQFIILRVNEQGERIPLTIARADTQSGTIDLIFQVVGKTTALLSTKNPGEYIQDLVGPLGRPTHIEKVGKVICVGGGTGVAVLYPITRGYKEAGNYVISIIGARTKGLLILENEMKEISDELYVTTDDGSYGEKGFVTDVLRKTLDNKKDIGLVVAIGPVPMMKYVSLLTKEYGVPTVVSLNSIMVDGTGMCGACRVTVGGKTKFTCVDGPEFDGHQVDFDELEKRLSAYEQEERLSMEKFNCTCG